MGWEVSPFSIHLVYDRTHPGDLDPWNFEGFLTIPGSANGVCTFLYVHSPRLNQKVDVNQVLPKLHQVEKVGDMHHIQGLV